MESQTPAAPQCRQLLSILGRRIAITSNASGVAGIISDTWGSFEAGGAARPDVDPDVNPDIAINLIQEDAESRLREWQCFNNGSVLVIADDRRLMTGYFVRKPWKIDIRAFRESDAYMYYYLFEPVLLMLLARLGLVHWHSGAVARDGQAVLISGVSGSGKSTSSLRLLTSGFDFVADDEIFLEAGQGDKTGVRVHGVDRHIFATDDTVEMFPALHHLLQTPLVQRGHGLKRRVPVQELFANGLASDLPVRLVLFPTVARGEPTTLRELPVSAAMMRFMEHKPKESSTLVPDPAALDCRLETYRSLAMTARCFDVTLGGDADRLPELVTGLLR